MTQVEQAYRLLESGDVGEAVTCLEAAGARGDAESLLELGVWVLEGRYLPRDLPRSREYFRRSGELGDVRAERVYICFLANGVGGQGDWRAAKRQLEGLASRDSNAARQLSLLADMALDENGYPIRPPHWREISRSPDMRTFDHILSAAECDYLIETAEPLLQQSVVVDPATGQMRPHPVRTSEGAVFPWASEDMVISALNRRIAVATGTAVECGEPLQVLRYSPGQEYRSHFDALPAGGNQRVVTMLLYLNDGYEGGETFFTKTGLKFSGRKGDGLSFRNALDSGFPDPNAEHAGLPVSNGQKFIASRWIRERPLMPR